MSFPRARLRWLFLFAVLRFWAETPVSASTVFSGTLATDGDVRAFFFQVPVTTSVEIRTLGYAGGVTSDGATVSPGGFDPFLTLLFFPGGNIVTTNDDDPNALVDPITGQGLDSSIQQVLSPASYMIVLSQYGNVPNGTNLIDGFSQLGNPTFTNDPAFAPGDSCPNLFKDSTGGDGRCRNGNYTVEISNASNVADYFVLLGPPPKAPNTTPEPCTLLTFVFSGIALLGIKRYRRALQIR